MARRRGVARQLLGAGLRFAARKALVALAAWLGVPVGALVLGLLMVAGMVLGVLGLRQDVSVAPERDAFVRAAAASAPARVSADGAEEAYRVPWGLLFMVWQAGGGEPPADRAAPQLARELAPRIAYRDSVVVRQWTDASGESHQEEQRVKLVAEVLTYRGRYRHRYTRVTESSGAVVVTREAGAGVEYSPDYSLLQEVLARWAPGWRPREDELADFVTVAEAATWGAEEDLNAEGDDVVFSGALGSDLPVQFSGDPGGRVWPADGPITSPFGMRFHPVYGRWRMHTGVDIGLPVGAPVRAAWGGRVAFAGWAGELGLAVAVDHGTGEFTVYGHLSRLDVRAGQDVAAGQVLGGAGATGVATGPHLHFAVWRAGKPLDPLAWLPPR